MEYLDSVEQHYAIGNFVEAIKTGLEKIGKTQDSVTIEDLSLVDEFHIGGRLASEHFFDLLSFNSEQHILDVGCGIGGASRFVADRFGVQVSGVDLTTDYIETGRALNKWVGLEDRINFKVGNALSLEFDDKNFDGAFTMHVLMNIRDKLSVFREVQRVLTPGAVFGIYDIMKYGDGDFAFPVPWATGSSASFLATREEYIAHLEAAGFDVESVNDRHEFAVDFFEAVRTKMESVDGPPPLGIHIHMGRDAKLKVKNLTENLQKGLAAPFEIRAIKR